MSIINFLDAVYSKEKISNNEYLLTKTLYLKYVAGYWIRFNRKFKKSEEYKIFQDINLINQLIRQGEGISMYDRNIKSQKFQKYWEEKKITEKSIGKIELSSLEFFSTDNEHIYESVQTILILLDERKKNIMDKLLILSGNVISFLLGSIVTLTASSLK